MTGTPRSLAALSWSPATLPKPRHLFDPDILTLGFARRFATYKRPNLLLQNPERLERLLTNSQRPVQIFIAGKAHPADEAGQAMIREWVQFIRRPEIRPHAVFLGDYDMLLTEHLVQGVDVWLNTPRRPWEASGTSGMKVLVNGGLNLSELDGWWAEAYAPEVGWALGDGQKHNNDPAWDAVEAEQLYQLLEQEIVPAFYTRDANGIPTAWVARMRESMARLAPQYSANRAVREYTQKYYLPALAAYRERIAEKGALAAQIVNWQHTLEQQWSSFRFGAVKVNTTKEEHVFEVQVFLDEAERDSIVLELYADGRDVSPPVRKKMVPGRKLAGSVHGYAYEATVSASRPASDYTPRIIPWHPEVQVPLEATQILWQR